LAVTLKLAPLTVPLIFTLIKVSPFAATLQKGPVCKQKSLNCKVGFRRNLFIRGGLRGFNRQVCSECVQAGWP